MKTFKKELILKEIPLFAGLSPKELLLVKEKSSLVEYRKGQIIYREGSSPSGFYCIVLGRVVISALDYQGKETILEYLHRGKYFGVISLLTGEPHSVTTKAINDCLLLVIDKEDFNFLLKKVSSLAIDLSRTLSRRLKRKDIHTKKIFESTIISAFSSYPRAGKTIYAANLAFGLKKETHKSVVILDICPKIKIHSMPRRLGMKSGYKVFDLSSKSSDINKIKEFISKDKFDIDIIFFNYRPKDKSYIRMLLGILSLLVNDYHYIILDLPSYMDDSIFGILNQSDIIHLLTSPDLADLKRTRRLIQKMKDDFLFSPSKIKVIINEYKTARISYTDEVKILDSNIFAVLPRIESKEPARLFVDKPACEYTKAIRRIARQEGDCMVGLALGIGVAYGFCHIGVLKVIEEEKIPIDVITGSSMGAFVAGLWALGKTSKEILDVSRELRAPRWIFGMLDFTFPNLGFIKGNRLYSLIQKYFQDKTFYDLKIPLKIIASDIKMKEPRILDKGLLADAIMASCSMPGVFKPFRIKEDALFDGGVVHPLPTEPLFEMGVKKIIAVNVTPSRQDILKQYEKIKEMVINSRGADKKQWFNLGEYFKEKFKTNILDIIFSSFEMLQSTVAEQEGNLADIVLHPDTSGMHWLELHKAEEFAKRGEEEARKHLDKIWKVINE